MNKNILVFEYLVHTGGEQSVKMIAPQYVSIKQKDTYDPLFPESPNLKIINCDRDNIGNNTYKSLTSTKGTLSIDDKTTTINLKNNETFMSIN